MARLILLAALLLPLLPAAVVQEFTFTVPPPANWVIENLSDGPPTDPQFQDGWVHSVDVQSALPFGGRTAADDPFMFSSVFSSSLAPGAIASNWLVAPTIDLRISRFFSFYTIGAIPSGDPFPDRLRVLFRQGSNAAALQTGDGGIGVTANDEGLYTQLLLEINPTLAADGYPQTWTQYTVELPDTLLGNYGRVAFRFYSEDAFAFGNAIGIDDVTFNTPEPATMLLIGLPLVAFGIFRRRNTPKAS